MPKPPGTPIVTETTATSVTITWDSGNPDPVSYYIIQYRAKGPDSKFETVDSITTTRYSIGGLYPNTEYEIRVSAFNSIGQGPSSTRVEARTGEQAPASPPRNVQAHIISQNTVMVRWEEPEEPNGQVGRALKQLSLFIIFFSGGKHAVFFFVGVLFFQTNCSKHAGNYLLQNKFVLYDVLNKTNVVKDSVWCDSSPNVHPDSLKLKHIKTHFHPRASLSSSLQVIK